jgi:ferritin-like metal-binding protein YciE
MNALDKSFLEELADRHDVEKQLVQAIPKTAHNDQINHAR